MKTFDVGKLAVYWRTKARKNEPSRIPTFLSFSFSYDEELELIQQTKTAVLMKVLDQIYSEDSNVGYLQEGHDLASAYGDDFIEFVKNCFRKFENKPTRILEVGCGGCYLLRQFKEQGFEVVGVDPSPVAVKKAREMGIRLLQGYFPDVYPKEAIDLVYHVNVLEHVSDPAGFLYGQRKRLVKDGWLMISVPDCTPSIVRGDLSMVIHQHLNFFDTNSLAKTVEKAGFEVLDIQKSKVGGSLYCLARNSEKEGIFGADPVNSFDGFISLLQSNISKLTSYLNRFKGNSKRSLGIFVPLRAIPYLCLAECHEGFRFFDDDRGVHGRYFDGFDVPVESRQGLVEKPVTDLMITSWSYGDKLKKELAAQLPESTKITILEEIVA